MSDPWEAACRAAEKKRDLILIRAALEAAKKAAGPKGPRPHSPWIAGVGPDPHTERELAQWDGREAALSDIDALDKQEILRSVKP